MLFRSQKIPVISDHPFYNPKDGGESDATKPKNRSRSSSSTLRVSKKNRGSFKGKLKKNSKRKPNSKKISKRKKG